MSKKHQSNWNIEDLTDGEIYEAIRRLDPDPTTASKENIDSGVVICVGLWIAVIGCIGFMWLYW
jgi:hypothetical protein